MEDVFALLDPESVWADVVPGCDLITCLAEAGAVSGAFQYMGGVTVEVRGGLRDQGGSERPEQVIRRLHGLLEWSGPEPDSIAGRVHQIYPTPGAWRRAIEEGEIAELDHRLRHSLGFVDSLREERAERWAHHAKEPRLVTVDAQGRVQRREPASVLANGTPVWGDREHVRRFMRRNKQELGAVAREFSQGRDVEA
ncbi:hypothetical protein [Nocardiopsis suaedae]|uniref:Uncharacterized protein n=1 Tax=Nocardiopsis suaedae TaxID=3018444 RepID=A0ABT4TWP3_9ACTN|nr:hypothetical protein [Nocardiopsis suaedae]MDA2808542.1 hypothetical protein [Nocardiopsis suaedae]